MGIKNSNRWMKRRHIRFIITITIGTITIFLLLFFAGFNVVMEALVKTRKDYFFLALSTVVLTLLVRNVRWGFYLQKAGYKARFTTLFPTLLAGCFFENLTPARIGEFFRPVILRFKENVAVLLTLPTVLVERTLDLGVALSLAFLGVVIMLTKLQLAIRFTIIFGMLIMLILMGLVLYLPRTFTWIVRLGIKGLKTLRTGWRENLENEVLEAADAAGKNVFVLLRNKSVTTFGLILTLIIWLLNGLRLCLVLKSLGLDISPFYATVVVVFTVLVATASMIPLGQGPAEFAMAFILTSLGYPFELSVVAAILDKFLAVWLVAIFGAIAGSRLGYFKLRS